MVDGRLEPNLARTACGWLHYTLDRWALGQADPYLAHYELVKAWGNYVKESYTSLWLDILKVGWTRLWLN
jgi:hypothetical protein